MIGKWTVRNSSYIHRDRWISLRADDCLTPAGVDVTPYYVLEYPDFVHCLCFDFARRAVLVRQYRHGFGDFSLELPGGCADQADTDPVSTAMRELQEETGYVGESGRLLTSLTVDPGKFSNRLHLVLIENAKPTAETRLDEAEDVETVLIPEKELAGLALGGKIINAAHVGLIMIGLEAAGV